jgi:hypothetical protein
MAHGHGLGSVGWYAAGKFTLSGILSRSLNVPYSKQEGLIQRIPSVIAWHVPYGRLA